MADREEMSRSFGTAAGAYEAGRPDYPLAAVEWMLEPARREGHALRVADVGAGTGKLTRVVVEAGGEAVAIDPDPAMLESLRAAVHGIPTFVGTAEGMPLRDASVDAVVLGQAWHWVDPDLGAAEAARVLRPGGALGLIWNIRDESVPWVAALTRAMHGSHAEQMLAGDGVRVGEPFGAPESRTWTWTRTMTREALLHMVASRSYIITATGDERARILDEVEALFDAHAQEEMIELPYVTHVYRAVRP
ncbi:class I SAM-dependent methyltransferase [Microbacterium aoyamense]|uniref:Class I SAM-dependent methyltransferase n=1 Tax=Microbacterium aoyamense TaxID=344166 RepID=A0ABN2Q081_9MICO|nr:class I SAM-dependent methyltransferase [Microbacterium aoyamense]